MNEKFLPLVFFLLSFSIFSTAQNSTKLFNGYSLDGWEITDLEGHGTVTIEDSCIILGTGNYITGINWVKDFPATNYEVTLEAMRVEGNDFFCGLTFPVKGSFLTLVLGGWRGSIVGLSCIDGYDAANNFTGLGWSFENNRWYKVRLRVTDEKVEAWIDNDMIVDFATGTYYLSLRMEMELSIPLGFATYDTKGALRNITLRTIAE
jgi:hypothetical protein